MDQFDADLDSGLSMEGFEETPARWPRVLGWFSVVIGVLGIIKNACGAVVNLGFGGNMPIGQRAEQKQAIEDALSGMGVIVGSLGVLAIVSTGVSVLLLVAGVQLLKRRPGAVRLHRGWALVRLFVGLIEMGLAYVQQSAVMKATIESMPTGQGAPPPAQMATCMNVMLGCGMTIGLLLVLAYPVTVLAVLSRPWAKAEVAKWQGAAAA
ncbi:MAG: hypothetical protein Q8L55_16040 [Phycisphaerales bacterium]|nr:hypothetical protein [Phycisphaerales bacterium]